MEQYYRKLDKLQQKDLQQYNSILIYVAISSEIPRNILSGTQCEQ